MRIILNEIKKIFNLKTIFILILGIGILYKIFPSSYVEYFPNGQPATGIYEVMKEMQLKYGNTLDKDEFKDFKTNFRNEKIKLADKYLSNNEEAKKLGIEFYSKLKTEAEDGLFDEPKDKSDITKLYEHIMFNKNSKEFWDLNAIDYIIERYNNKGSDQIENKPEWFKNRYKEIYSRPQPIIYDDIIRNYNVYIGGISLIIIASIMFALGSVFIKDKSLGVDYIQYSSNIGRKIINKKIIAGLISSIILTTVILGTSLLIYFISNGTSEFFNTNINSIFSYEYIIDIKYLQYIILTIIIIYIIAISTGLLTMFISNMGKNYIHVLSMGVPSCAVLIFISEKVVINDFLLLYRIQIIVIGLPIILIALGIILALRIIKSIKKRDILY